MGKIKDGFLMGIGIFIAFNVMGFLSTLLLMVVMTLINAIFTSGMVM